MNLLTISADLLGDRVTDSGLRVLEIHLPLFGKQGGHAPLFVVPSLACGETFGAFAPGTKLLVNGRLYPNRNDNKMYVVPNQPLQAVPKEVNLNQVNLAGGIGYINDSFTRVARLQSADRCATAAGRTTKGYKRGITPFVCGLNSIPSSGKINPKSRRPHNLQPLPLSDHPCNRIWRHARWKVKTVCRSDPQIKPKPLPQIEKPV